tara:strand:+ start:220 stop:591 length:372 start_codon:yes stop_codon:yes gene_type:complete
MITTINENDSLISLKVYEPKGERQIKYIATTKEWYDKINGNSYFSTRIEDVEKDLMYILPFQYGYESQSEYATSQLLRKLDKTIVHGNIKHIKINRCLKKEVVEHGQGQEENYNSELKYYYQD